MNGVSSEQLAKIELRVKSQSDGGWLGSLFSLLPLLFLEVMMVAFMHQGSGG